MTLLLALSIDFCKHCLYGKHERSLFGVGQHTSGRVLAYIHNDVWGRSRTPSHFESLYYVSFIDDYSYFVWIYLLKHKSKVLEIFQCLKVQFEIKTNLKMTCLRIDNSKETLRARLKFIA